MGCSPIQHAVRLARARGRPARRPSSQAAGGGGRGPQELWEGRRASLNSAERGLCSFILDSAHNRDSETGRRSASQLCRLRDPHRRCGHQPGPPGPWGLSQVPKGSGISVSPMKTS